MHAKETWKWLLYQVETINHAFSNNDTGTLFKKTSLLTMNPKVSFTNIKYNNGYDLLLVDDAIQRWEENAHELFHSHHQRPLVVPYPVIPRLPTTDEITAAIKCLKNNKAPGSDLVFNEFIKSLG